MSEADRSVDREEMTEGRIVLVSGANRGIGFEIARQLGQFGLTVLLGARDTVRGEEAAGKLRDEGLSVHPVQLDVSSDESVRRLRELVEREYGRLDVLVNNAGVIGKRSMSSPEADLDSVRRLLETNLFGAWRLTQAFVPLMHRNGYGRIVNLSSGMGQLAGMGGGASAYRVSKTSLNALTCMLAADLREANILVNSVCPGWVRTDMGGPNAARSVEQGAETPVWLATLPDGGPSGGFFRDRQPIPW